MLIVLKCSLLLLGMAAISVKCSKLAESHCPEAYWDEPSRDCSKHLVHHLQHGDSFNSHKINKTCMAWESTKACYQRLIHSCKSDSTAIDVIKSHLSRYYVYSSPCASRTPRELEPMTSCFLKEFISTQTCSEAFDSKFRSYILERQYSHACRIVTSIMRCFLNIMRNRISNHCGEDGSEEFRQTYIEPIVHQSRVTVASKCTLPPEVTEFYFVPTLSSTSKPHLAHLPFTVYVVLLVTR